MLTREAIRSVIAESFVANAKSADFAFDTVYMLRLIQAVDCPEGPE